MARIEGICTFCEGEIRTDRIGFRELCPHCDEALHCCLQCRFYDTSRPDDCAEPQAELIRDKDRPNLCDWFEFTGGTPGEGRGSGVSRDQAEQMLKDLFNKG